MRKYIELNHLILRKKWYSSNSEIWLTYYHEEAIDILRWLKTIFNLLIDVAIMVSKSCLITSGHVGILSWHRCWFSIGSRARVRLTCRKYGRFVRKAVNASPGLKFIRIITWTNIFCWFVLWVYMVIIKLKTESQKNNKQETSLQSYKIQIKILPSPGLA